MRLLSRNMHAYEETLKGPSCEMGEIIYYQGEYDAQGRE